MGRGKDNSQVSILADKVAEKTNLRENILEGKQVSGKR